MRHHDAGAWTRLILRDRGSYGHTGNGGVATAALLRHPYGITVDSTNNLYILDAYNSRVQMVPSVTGTYFGQAMTASYMYTIAGDPTGNNGDSGDGSVATSALLNFPAGIYFDTLGNLYIGDTTNQRIQMVPTTSGSYFGQAMTANNMYTIAGPTTGAAAGYYGDGGSGTSALLNQPSGVAVTSSGVLYFSEQNNNVIRVLYP